MENMGKLVVIKNQNGQNQNVQNQNGQNQNGQNQNVQNQNGQNQNGQIKKETELNLLGPKINKHISYKLIIILNFSWFLI